MKQLCRVVFFSGLLFQIFIFANSLEIGNYPFQKITILSGALSGVIKGGPDGVTRSLVDGFKKMGVCFNHNPGNEKDFGDVVVVLGGGIGNLQRAISLKRGGKINRLIAGPCLMVLSNEYNHILCSPEIDIYMVNSVWTKVAYIEDEPSLRSHITIWPAGVDAEYWKPELLYEEREKSKDVLVYSKLGDRDTLLAVEELLKKYGWNPVRIIYGSYDHAQYKKVLSRSRFAVFLLFSESQGLALAEAWSMDVPTFVLNPRRYSYAGKTFSLSSTCPYLSSFTGMDWRTIDDLDHLIKSVQYYLDEFYPRAWVLENMTDEVCAEKILAIINSTF